jgi:[FeFe] hydrogenase H-cluster maturation GTPase HydF
MTNLNETPKSERLHITIFGKRNTGKSSLINLITNQNTSLVSDIAGTTTDPVRKAIEINGIGPCIITDTAGFDDEGYLGSLRNEKTISIISETDIAIILLTDENLDLEIEFVKKLKNTPIIFVISKSDELSCDRIKIISEKIKRITGMQSIAISNKTKSNIDNLLKAIINNKPYKNKNITGHLVSSGDFVLLVMPQDQQAPHGRLILPQAQIIRDLLNNECIVSCITKNQFKNSLNKFKSAPKLIITDSQILDFVYNNKPTNSLLSSFSILFARHKGDIKEFIKGANKLDDLKYNSHILIAEACSHIPCDGDIGRIQIPNLIKKYVRHNISIEITSGNLFPNDLSKYDLIIHCGACMFNNKYMLSRIEHAQSHNVSITNYGIVLAKLYNILDKIVY